MKFIETSSPLNSSDIDKIEEELGFKLPESLLSHYLKSNGGIPENQYFYSEDHERFFYLRLMKPFTYQSVAGETYTIEDSYRMYAVERKALPKHLLPFGTSHGGGLFCINIKDESILLVEMDLGEVTDETVFFLSDSLTHFLTNLEEEGDD